MQSAKLTQLKLVLASLSAMKNPQNKRREWMGIEWVNTNIDTDGAYQYSYWYNSPLRFGGSDKWNNIKLKHLLVLNFVAEVIKAVITKS